MIYLLINLILGFIAAGWMRADNEYPCSGPEKLRDNIVFLLAILLGAPALVVVAMFRMHLSEGNGWKWPFYAMHKPIGKFFVSLFSRNWFKLQKGHWFKRVKERAT